MRFDPRLLRDHYSRHGAAVGATSAADYEARADAFLSSDLDATTLVGQDNSGNLIRYNPVTQEFGVVSPSGLIRTYYKLRARRNKSPLQYFQERVLR